MVTSASKWLNLARTGYGALRKHRTTVRVAQPTEFIERMPQAFILANYRAGTTLLRYALDSHPRIACPPESDFIQLFDGFFTDPAQASLQSLGYDQDHVARKLEDLSRYFLENYTNSSGKVRWVDKSPRYVDHIETLERVFPEAKFIALHRHPLDQIYSLTKGGSFDPFHPESGEDLLTRAALLWSRRTHEIIKRHDADNTFMLRYEDLCVAPRLQLAALLEWLGEDWSENVLQFHKYTHDAGKESVRVQGTTGFVASSGRYRSWPKDQISTLWNIVEDEARLLGYHV